MPDSNYSSTPETERMARGILENINYGNGVGWSVKLTRRKRMAETDDQYYIKPGDTVRWPTGDLEVGAGSRKTTWHDLGGEMDKSTDKMSNAKRNDPDLVRKPLEKGSCDLAPVETGTPRPNVIDAHVSPIMSRVDKIEWQGRSGDHDDPAYV